MDEDQHWIELFLEGNLDAFERLVLKYRRSAIVFGQHFVKDFHTAEDIAQESFAEFYVYRARFNSNYKFKTYLFTIIRNKCVDYLRKHSKVQYEEAELMSRQTTEEEVLQREKKVFLYETMKQLKTDYRTAVYLIDIEQFSYKEASAIMRKSTVQMKILIYRARKKMKLLLEQEG
ncbi:RNA polymerase sigma factor [Paenibacillus eucommiae]|uniref:RNA polymerase sigma-70 factor (ECF subfamily) n=1 Tax=Paenibacillus eucommiae TaxID=1355755 RepID=A0ABS4J871_9BACL|nr:sigma-70 family RNA polymerase sigma factor [Paenibacillus eucommiae]MBP1996049.1 RNA polymerase sigma-70 factor (ECF subfamily) [Paenibacillus eucommiae]